MYLNQRELQKFVSVARGDSEADLVLANARVVNTCTAEIEMDNIAISDRWIVGLGDYQDAREVIDLQGKYVIPGLINGHTHVESSLLDIGQYAQAVVPHGTSAVITDLHELSNVCGLAGMRYVLDKVRNLPLDLFLMVPSCVPATPLETAGAWISAEDVHTVLQWDGVIGLGEMMNFPGVLYGDREVSLKLALGNRFLIDGHAPGLHGKDLNAYVGTGICSDHECTELEEAQEKIRCGMYVMIREGSSEKNLEALLPLVTSETYPRCLFVVDDRSCSDLLRDGDIDAVVRKAIGLGMEPIRAIQLATINPARYFHLDRFGAIAPGYFANLIIMDDLVKFNSEVVFYNGRMVAKDGQSISIEETSYGDELRHTVNIGPFDRERLNMSVPGDTFPVIEIVPGQIVTKERRKRLHKKEGLVVADIRDDILKLVVVERHNASGNIGLGLVKGFGLKRGAMASSVAHDSHNIVAVGANDSDIVAAVRRIVELQGGLTIVAEGEVLAELPLPIGGLLSDQPLETVVREHEHLESVAASLGCELASPFATLSFVALPVIPELRLTDLGLVDVRSFKLVT